MNKHNRKVKPNCGICYGRGSVGSGAADDPLESCWVCFPRGNRFTEDEQVLNSARDILRAQAKETAMLVKTARNGSKLPKNSPRVCPGCGQNDPNYLTNMGSKPGSCWDKEACGQRSATYENAEMQDIRDCFTTDQEQMYVALRQIMNMVEHDGDVFLIASAALPPPQE